MNRQSNQNKRITLPFFLCLIAYFSFYLFPPAATADTVSNTNYSIDVDTIDTNPQPSPHQQVLGITNIDAKDFTTGPNYTSTPSNDSFSINISQDTIDYGILTSTNPVIRTSQISFSNPQSGAEILTYEDTPLQLSTKEIIQNTTCDNGLCTPITAALWTNTLTYGFGYRCDSQNGNSCDPQFSTSNSFKQYPDTLENQPLTPLLVSNQNAEATKATITNKVNISGTQKSGNYYNSITYLAIPNF